MKKTLLVLTAMLLITGCSAPMYEVQRVKTHNGSEGVRSGTGFAVGYMDGYTIIATAKHVLRGGDSWSVMTDQNSAKPVPVDAKIFNISDLKDIAFLKIKGKIDTMYRICHAIDDELIVTASRISGDWDHTSKLTGYRLEYGRILAIDSGFALTDADSKPGHSGSPAISIKRQCVIGVVIARTPGYTTIQLW